ncbi:MAG: hypothetical protein WCW02_04625 [Candidatus Buchananbacteria bacterium]
MKNKLFISSLAIIILTIFSPYPTQAKTSFGFFNLNTLNPFKYWGHTFNLVGEIKSINQSTRELTITTDQKSQKIKHLTEPITVKFKPNAKIIFRNKPITFNQLATSTKAFVWGRILANELEADKMIITPPKK